MAPTLLASKPLGGSFSTIGDLYNATGADAPDLLNLLLSNIFGFLTIVGGLAFLIYFVIGAISWITAGGDQQKVETARKYMTNGAVGMIIIVGAYAIIAIVGQVLGIDLLNPGELIKAIGA
jgi:hypothetical protein